MVSRGLGSLVYYLLIVLHLHQLLLLAVKNHLLTLVWCSRCALMIIILFVRRVAYDKVVNLRENLHISTIIHHYNIIIVTWVVFMDPGTWLLRLPSYTWLFWMPARAWSPFLSSVWSIFQRCLLLKHHHLIQLLSIVRNIGELWLLGLVHHAIIMLFRCVFGIYGGSSWALVLCNAHCLLMHADLDLYMKYNGIFPYW